MTGTKDEGQRPKDAWRLDGYRALVTGGSKGIGLAVARQLAALGADVIVVARSQRTLDDAVAAAAAEGTPLSGIAADVATADGRDAVTRALSGRWPALDILVNNAGTNIRKPTTAYSETELAHLIATNLTSAFELSGGLQPLLNASGRASIVNVGSVAGLVHVGTGSVYAMTKAALAQLTRSLAVEWARYHITVNAIAPTYTATVHNVVGRDDPDFVRELVDRIPLGRLGLPEDLIGAVVYLASPSADMVTGQTLAIDGGWTAW